MTLHPGGLAALDTRNPAWIDLIALAPRRAGADFAPRRFKLGHIRHMSLPLSGSRKALTVPNVCNCGASWAAAEFMPMAAKGDAIGVFVCVSGSGRRPERDFPCWMLAACGDCCAETKGSLDRC